jgi:hypothetical protein
VSERAAQLFGRIVTLTDDLFTLDAREKSSHQTTWRRRGELIRAIEQANTEFTGEVERIVGAGTAAIES